MRPLFVLSFLAMLVAFGSARVLLVEEPAFMEAGCGAMPEGMKSACCDLNPMDPACGGWVCGACLGLNTIDLAQCCRLFPGALGCPGVEIEGNVFDDPMMNNTSTNTTNTTAPPTSEDG